MSSLISASTIILIEIATALSAISGYFIYKFLRSNRNLNSTLGGLAKKINHKRESHESMLKSFLEETCHFEGEEAQKMANEMVKKERMFYATLMNTYKNRDNEALKDLDKTTEEITNSYKQLLTVSAKATTESMQETLNKKTHKLSSTINTLTEKNQELAKELSQLQHEMDMTVNEFTSAFQREQQEKEQQQKSQAAATSPASEDATAQDTADNEEPANEVTETPDEIPADNSENIDVTNTLEDAQETSLEEPTEYDVEDGNTAATTEAIEEAQNEDDNNVTEETNSDDEELAELDDAPTSVEPAAEAESIVEGEPEPEPAPETTASSSETLHASDDDTSQDEENFAAEANTETNIETNLNSEAESGENDDDPEKNALTESLSELDGSPEETTTKPDNDELSAETINSDLMEGLDELADALDDLKEVDEKNKANPAA